MAKMLAVIPENCSGCRMCELVCAIQRFGVNNPKKSAIRVLVTYPQPVVRMPIVCSQCKVPVCADACPDTRTPIKCDLCEGLPQCVQVCPKNAIMLIPEEALGEAKRMTNVLSYTHMKEIEFVEEGEKKTIHYAEIGKEEL
ncbi:MAG: 4Fe-4S dicluster domain-containing protein [Planctomycetota bacterium]|jgi:Fe-S-cluster-containing hydrogenase component 2